MLINYLPYIIPILALFGLAYLGYRYINLFLKINKLENEFASIINHTFRTPITRILWVAKELDKDLPREERLSYIQSITNATNRILDIVNIVVGIKKISDLSDYYFEAVSLREIIEGSIAKFGEKIREKNIMLSVPSFQDIPLLSVDLKKISFVVDSLIENAVSYVRNGGEIIIECLADKNSLTLYVVDNGIGLSPVDKLRIFSRFYRNKRAVLMNTDGMGLCLHLSKKIIKRHRGQIKAKSKGMNKGSTFILKLPFSR